MVYFVSETFRFGFWGLVRPKSSLPSSKTDQNELRRLNQASIDGLRCLGVPSDPPIDISCTWTRSELFGMENLAVTSVWQMCDKLWQASLSHICHIGFRLPWGEKLRKLNWEIEFNTIPTQRAVWIRFWLLWVRIPQYFRHRSPKSASVVQMSWGD